MSVSATEFQAEGFLQEANRRFFHPLGLALTLEVTEGEAVLKVLDARDDPEGIVFTDLSDEAALSKYQRVEALLKTRTAPRVAAMGWVVQPIGSRVPAEECTTTKGDPR